MLVIADGQNALPRARVAQVSAQIAQRRALSDEARKLIDQVSRTPPARCRALARDRQSGHEEWQRLS